MCACPDIREVFLAPGEYHFGGGYTRVATVLGSCVSVAAWHPALQIGGMCHFMLPQGPGNGGGAFDGRYANSAMQWLRHEMACCGTTPQGYRIHVLGGSSMFACDPSLPAARIGERNIEAARELLKHHGFPTAAADVGGASSRRVMLEVWSGRIDVARTAAFPIVTSDTPLLRTGSWKK